MYEIACSDICLLLFCLRNNGTSYPLVRPAVVFCFRCVRTTSSLSLLLLFSRCDAIRGVGRGGSPRVHCWCFTRHNKLYLNPLYIHIPILTVLVRLGSEISMGEKSVFHCCVVAIVGTK
jgi:hypothetical protein